MHPPPRSIRVTQSAESQDKKNRSKKITDLSKYAAYVHGSVLLPCDRSFPFSEHLQHTIDDHKTTDHVDRGTGHGQKTKYRAYDGVMRTSSNQGANQRDTGDRVGCRHPWTMQERRHARAYQVAKECGQDQNVEGGDQGLGGHRTQLRNVERGLRKMKSAVARLQAESLFSAFPGD